MPKSHYKLVLIAGVILAASLITTSILLSGFSKPQLPAQPPAQNATTKQAPNVQAAGRLPLPPNAIRRFGDLLFRTNSLIEYAFLDDAKVLFVRGIFRDIRTGKIIRRWDLKPPHGEIAFSSDKKLVACSREDGLLDIWEFDKQVRLHALPTDTSGGVNIIHNIKFSRDNKTLAANVSPKHVQVWNVATGKLQATLRDDPYNVNFAMSTDGGKIATWQHKRFHWHRCKSLRIWNVAKQKTLATFHRPGGDIIDADVAPDGKTVAIVEENGAVQVVDVKGNLLHKYKGPKDAAKIAFSPDGKRLVIAAKTGKTQRLRSSDLSRIDDCQGPACEVRDIIFAKDGRTMIYGRDGGVVCLWETSGRIISPRPGHHSSVIGVAFSPDGKKLISLGQNSANHGRGSHHGDAVRVWDVATGKQLRSLPALTDSLITELSPHGRYCAIGTQYTDFRNNGKCAVSITDIATGKQIGKIANQLQPLAFSADETILATASGNRTLCLWETATLRRLDVISLNDIYASAAALGAGARFVAYREADQLPVRSDDVKIWDRKLRKIVAVCKAPMGGRFSRIALSPDGKTLAAVTLGRGVATWRSRDGKFLGFLPGSEEHTKVGDNYVRLVFSKDGTMLATGRANLADVWDVARQKRIKRIEMPNDHTNHVNTLAISPDGHHLATGSSNTAILLWDLRGMD